MSDNDNLNLLEEDIDDGEYDLGNEEEDALLADDFQPEENTVSASFQLEEECTNYEYDEGQDEEDVLVLNDVEDLEAEIQDNTREEDEEEARSSKQVPTSTRDSLVSERGDVARRGQAAVRHSTGRSEDEDDKPEEERGRFKAERVNVGPNRGNVNIPDSLDTVHAPNTGNQNRGNQNRGQWRGRGRGPRGGFGGNRGHQGRPFYQQNGRGNQGPSGRGQGPTGRFGHGGFMRGGPGRGQANRGVQQQQPNKIHINPHFRGNVQPQPDAARLVWDPNCVPPIVNQQAAALPIHQAEQHGYMFQSPSQPTLQQTFHQQQALLQQQQQQAQQQQQQLQQQQQHLLQQQHHQQFTNQQQNFFQEPHVTPTVHTPSPWLAQQPPSSSTFASSQLNLMIQQPPQQQYNVGPSYHGYQQQQQQQPQIPQQTQQQLYHQQQTSHHQQQQFQQPKPQQRSPQQQQQQQQQHYQTNQRPIQGGSWDDLPSEGLNTNTRPHFQPQGAFEGRPRFAAPLMATPTTPRMRGSRFPMRGQTHRGQPRPLIRPTQQRTPPQKRLGVPVDMTEQSLRTPPKKPKRKQDITNLHQVETVDTLPDTTVREVPQSRPQEPEIEEDDELREYRKKIEKQKELRETILQQKEERRKLAALEVQRKMQMKDLQDNLAAGDASRSSNLPQGNAIATIVNLNTIEPSTPQRTPNQPRPRGRPMTQPQAGRGNFPRIQMNDSPNVQNQATGNNPMQQCVVGQNTGKGTMAQRLGPQIQQQRTLKMLPNKMVAVTNQVGNTGAMAQRGRGGVAMQRGKGARGGRGGVQRTVLQAQPKQGVMQQQANQMPMMPAVGQRMVTVGGGQSQTAKRVVLSGTSNPVGRTVTLRTGANQPGQRIVMPPQKPGTGRTVIAAGVTQQLPGSKSVIIENLAATTSSKQVLKICQSVGPLEKFTMTPSLRRADATFKNPNSALKFASTFHRKMIDLSLINVSLVTGPYQMSAGGHLVGSIARSPGSMRSVFVQRLE